MDARQQPSGLAGVGYILSLIGFIGALVACAGGFVYSVVLPAVLDDYTISVQSDVPVSALDSLPKSVEIAQRVPVTLKLEDPTVSEGAATFGAAVIPLAVAIIVSYSLLRIADSVRRSDAFTMHNVRRLRTIGLTLMIGGPLGDFVSQVIRRGLAEHVGVVRDGFFLAILGTLPLAGLGVLILAEVFRHGVRLREDVEATI